PYSRAVSAYSRACSGTQVDDRCDRTAPVRALVGGGDRDEDRRGAGHGCGQTTDAGLDLAVPVHVRVVEHGVASHAHHAVAGGLALEEDVDQPPTEVARVRALRQVQAGVADRGPDPVHIEGVLHHRVSDAVPPADAARVAHHHDLRAVELHAGGAGGDRRVQAEVVHHVAVVGHLDL